MKKWIDFLNNRCKYVRILQDLRESFQYLQKYDQKGRFVILFSDVKLCGVADPGRKKIKDWILEPEMDDYASLH